MDIQSKWLKLNCWLLNGCVLNKINMVDMSLFTEKTVKLWAYNKDKASFLCFTEC